MAECTSGDLVVLIMDNDEVEMLRYALMELWENNDRFSTHATNHQNSVLLRLMDAVGTE